MISATGHIPTQLLIGRHIKTNLPTPLSALQSCQSSPEDFRENDNKAKLSYSRHCDHRHGARSTTIRCLLVVDRSVSTVVSTFGIAVFLHLHIRRQCSKL